MVYGAQGCNEERMAAALARDGYRACELPPRDAQRLGPSLRTYPRATVRSKESSSQRPPSSRSSRLR
jgi:hypothetical protein